MDISIVIPVYNEEESIEPLYKAISNSMSPLPYSYEVLLVDDGSKDSTYSNAKSIASRDVHFKIIKLKNNSGQTAALNAGFQHASGNIIVTMDGDLQNDPDDIVKFIQKLNEGFDIVLGWRHERKDLLVSRKIPSKIANWLISKVTGVPVKDNGCAIRAYKAEVVQNFPMYSEMHRLMPVITALAGARFTQIKVKHHERQFGKSKYGLSRIYKVLLDLVALKTVFAFFYLPLYGFGLIAGIAALLSLIVSGWGFYLFITESSSSLVTTMGSAILFASLSLFLIFLGVISEVVYKTGNIKIEKLLKRKCVNKDFSFN